MGGRDAAAMEIFGLGDIWKDEVEQWTGGQASLIFFSPFPMGEASLDSVCAEGMAEPGN